MSNSSLRQLVLSIAILLSLVGCAGVQQREVDELEAKRYSTLMSDPSIQRLVGKVTLQKSDDYTLKMLSDDSFPDALQKESVLALDRIASAYGQEFIQLLETKGAPGNSTIVRQYFGASKDNRLALYQGAISFGEFNRTQKKLYEIQMQLIGKINAANAQQARAAWDDALKSMGDSFQARQRSTVNTNCYSYGNSVSCTSR